jgi:hypothetical protein
MDSRSARLALVGAACLLPAALGAQTVAAPFAGSYTLTSLGTPTGVPAQLGGVTFLNDNTLLIGGSANTAAGSIYSIGVVREAGTNRITGFSGPATLFASAPNIDGGLSFGPGGVLFATGYPNNTLLQLLPGSVAPDRVTALSTLPGTDVTSSVGGLAFVPAGYPGAGSMKIFSYNTGDLYTALLTPAGGGLYDVAVTFEVRLAGGPEGLVYVPPGSPAIGAGFFALVSEYSSGQVGLYQVDADGIPVVATRQTFVSGLTGAEGAVIDPLTGDFLFSTFGGGNQLVRVSGFAVPPTPPSVVPEPGTVLLVATGLLGVAGVRLRRRRHVA